MRMTTGQLRWFKAQFRTSLMAAAAMLGITEIAGAQGTRATTEPPAKIKSHSPRTLRRFSSAHAKTVIGRIVWLRCRF